MMALVGLLLAAAALGRGQTESVAPPAKGKRSPCTCVEHGLLFRRYGEPYGIPEAYLRALACRESRCKADDNTAPARGLMQITEIVRKSIPRPGTSELYTQADLLNPEVNVYLCCKTLSNAMHALKAVGEPPNWGDPRWVGLLTAGWNAGYSVKGGVARVVKYLKQHGLPANIDNVYKYGQAAGAVKWLWSVPHRLPWWRSVVQLYQEMSR